MSLSPEVRALAAELRIAPAMAAIAVGNSADPRWVAYCAKANIDPVTHEPTPTAPVPSIEERLALVEEQLGIATPIADGQ